MSKKQTVRKNAGGGSGPLPLRRSYERELLQEPKYRDKSVVKPTDRITRKEAMEMTIKLGPLAQAIADLDALGINPQISVKDNGDTTITATEKETGNVAVKLSVAAADGDTEVLELSSTLTNEAAFRGMAEEDETGGSIKLVGTPRLEQTQEKDAKQAGIDRYAESVRQRSQEQDNEITLSDLQAFAKERGIEADGDAYRLFQQERMYDAQSNGKPTARQESGDLRKIIEDRGYDLDA